MNTRRSYRTQTASTTRSEAGFALMGALLLMLLISAIAVALVYATTGEVSIGGSDREDMLAYYGAEAGMEKMMADVGTLYTTNKSPTTLQIQALQGAAYQPVVSGVVYNEYSFTPTLGTDGNGFPISNVQTISSGSYQGLTAQVVPLTLTVTAVRPAGAQGRMQRFVQVALIPVFQFGVFSEGNLSYFPGPAFDFAGRVHTNGNLYLAESTDFLRFHSRITALGQVYRDVLANGVDATPRTGGVKIPQLAAGCDLPGEPACRLMAQNEGSMVGGSPNSNWVTISTDNSYFNNFIVNGATGASRLTLPFVGPGVPPIEIIRRPKSTDNLLTAGSRLYNLAQIRVLLSDRAQDLPGGLTNLPGGGGDNQTIILTQGLAGQIYGTGIGPTGVSVDNGGAGVVTPFGQGNSSVDPNWITPPSPPSQVVYAPNTDFPINPGYLRVEYRNAAGNYIGVTTTWLNFGFARQGLYQSGPNVLDYGSIDSEHGGATGTNTVHPKAIFILQKQTLVNGGDSFHQWYPINFYDTREGEVRDNNPADTTCAVNGIMSSVELDVNNLKNWLTGAAGFGATGTLVESTTQNGYVLYFSDRRGMRLASGETEFRGEYGWEDNLNPGDPTGAPNGVRDNGEDVNENNVLDTYGAQYVGSNFFAAGTMSDPTRRTAGACGTAASPAAAEANLVSAARHALKIVNGTLGNVPIKADGTGGFSVASENPVYVKGNFNANDAGWNGQNPAGESASAVMADAFTLLSNSWNDRRSFIAPKDPSQRTAIETWYRLAIAGGKNMTFTQPTGGWAAADFGTDGGVHNFLRYLENWSTTLHYQGSLVSFYYAMYGNGIYKCCTTVYSPPTRDYSFDVNFLNPQLTPPGTPRFQDVVNLGYRQDFTPQ